MSAEGTPPARSLTAALADRYRIERELGAGGMATVYLADDLRHHRRVALKVIRSEVAEGMGSQRFLREIRLAASLHHPNILPLYDSGDAGGALYYVMPVAEGESLRDRLAREKSLPVGDAVRLAGEVADALDYAHRHGVVHRDIKPENVLLHEGHALVTDFGIGKALSTGAQGATLTQVGLAVGTPAYMSPEQAGGEPNLDGRSDLYSLGCVLYEMLTGEQPFTGASVQAVIAKRFREAPPDASAAHAGVPRAVAEVARRLMALEPGDRFATGALASEALAKSRTPGGTAAVERDSGAALTTPTSVAVLPFANMSGAADDEYFSDGISEEIINALTQLPGLRVAARTSAFSFKGKNEDLRGVGEKLGVTTVLEGSVRRAGSRLRITAQLVNVADGYHIWSERYDRENADIFAIQDEIAGAIASKLRLSLSGGEGRALVRPPTANLDAYDLLLKGRALIWQRGRAILEAIPVLERAVALDPGLADAHGWLGDAWRLKWLYGMAPAAETIPRALTAIDQALAVDADNLQALAALANIRALHDLDIDASLALSARALARDPSFVQALCERSVWQALRPDVPSELWAESLRNVRAARELDPLSSWAAAIEVFIHLAAGRTAEAVRCGRDALALDPAAFTGRWVLVWSLSASGQDDEALALANQSLPMSGRNPRLLTEMAAIHARRGDLAPVQEILHELTRRRASGFVEACVVGCVSACAGDLEGARALVAQGIAEHEPYVQFAMSPAWAPFRADPAGRALLKRVGQ